jgi:glycerophosphoryl diester phosphodiesterase
MRHTTLARFRTRCHALLLTGLLALSAGAGAFELQAHRGARGLLPENTLAGFERALAIGVTTLELDIAITADGVPVISHDPALHPALTRDPSGRWLAGTGPLIRSLTLAQLQQYDVGRLDPASPYARDFPHQQPRDGERIPTLAALFERVKALGADHVQFAIETKIHPDRPQETVDVAEFVDRVLAVVRQAGMTERVRIISFDWRTLQRVQQLAPSVGTVYITIENPRANNVLHPVMTAGLSWHTHRSAAAMIKAAGGGFWSPNFHNIDAGKVKAAQQLGLRVIPWTVNETADMERLIAWGVDGIVTDYPDRLRGAMQRAGLALPPPVAR